MSVSVVMVSYRTGPSLFDAIASVLASEAAELVLVDHDNPQDDRARLDDLAAIEPRLKILRTNANLGFAKGCNLGAALASGECLFFLNPDAQIDPDAPARLAETAAGRTEPVIVGARLVDAGGREQRGGRRSRLTLPTAVRSFAGLGGFDRSGEPLPEGPVETPVVSGAAMLMTRAGFEALGGFDEDYFLHVEDVDLCERARKAGGTVVFEPRVAVRHAGATSDVSSAQVERWKAQSFVTYFRKHGGPVQAALIAPLVHGAIGLRRRLRQGRRA
ncbi:MAG: glycosyltransferase family 2 protein [Oceanicaulis sp.]